jgi:glycosyltransferase involved in cell wall biosynthesis
MESKKGVTLMENLIHEFKDILHLFINTEGGVLMNTEPRRSDLVIIYPPTIDWSWMKQRPQQLMESLSQNGFQVYYCNKTQSKNELSVQINPQLTVVQNHQYFITHTIPELKRQGKKIILWVSWSKLCAFLNVYLPDFIVYDYIDDFAAWRPYLKPMIHRADIVVTSSTLLRDQIEKDFPQKPSYFIPNGCDLNHFKPQRPTKPPKDMAYLNGPIITYSGAWAKWVDEQLVYRVADTFKHAFVVIIGPEFGAKVNRNLPNLRYLGYKNYEELPAYLQNSTVCMIPFRLDDITLATNPIKMYEYLAAGAPVVSTDIPEVRGIPSVHIGLDHESFIEKIRLILEKKLPFNADEVYGWLEANSWEQRCRDILSILKKHGFSPVIDSAPEAQTPETPPS